MNIPLIKEMLSLNLRGAYKWGGQNAFYEPGKDPIHLSHIHQAIMAA
ncbi:hypothetical protein V3I05_00015 [Helicobacter mastomyrinus]|uniref:Uncharacterized protein n=1 Tax=Helicobacter mastomyrinus TaxID=287948 RepID=A0ABZ3F4L6_9HELI